MKRILKNTYLLAFIGLLLGGCSKFEEINTDPTAANVNQVQVEYFINQSLIKDQQNPGVSERAFILYWVAAGRQITDADGATFSHGKYNDQWLGAYYSNISSALNSANTAIEIGKEQIENGSNKPYTANMIQVARIWRAFLMSEMSDCFGPIPIDAFQGKNPDFSSVKDVYYYMLDELKDATSKIDPNTTVSDQTTKDEDLMYGFNFKNWQRYGNSLRLRLAMRLSEADPQKAEEEFEDAAKGPLLEDNANIFKVPQQDGWDDATGVYSRSWYTLPLTATLNNLTVNLGGIKTEDQLKDFSIVPADTLSTVLTHIKSNDYVGIKSFDYFPTHTDNPVAGYWYDGLHETIDPRMYQIFYIPGNINSSSFPSHGSVSDNTVGDLFDIQNKDPNKTITSIDAGFSWNGLQDGDAGILPTYNQLINPSTNGFIPSLADQFRTSTKDRILFAPWETYFLIAEAKVRGWTVDGISAKEAYEKGIESSFAFWGVSKYVSDYLNSTDYNTDGTSVKWDHTTEAGSSHIMNYSTLDGATDTVYINYPTNELHNPGENNSHLVKILTQKFIAQTPWLPRETWSDHRRTGLPFFENVVVEPSGNGLEDLGGLANDYMTSSQKYLPQRMKYPSSLRNSNEKGYNEAVDFLGGDEDVLTPLWWSEAAQ